jgi:hypothetical protein
MLARCVSITLAVASAGILTAAPVDCVPGTVATYQTLGSTGCQVGPLIVKDFDFAVLSSGGGAPLLTAADIAVQPVSGPPSTLQFSSAGFSVTGNQFVNYLLGYTWDPTSDIRSLDDVLDNLVTPPGLANITTLACIGAAFNGPNCSTSLAALNVFDDGISPRLFDTISFPPVAVVGIRNTIDLEANGANASFTSFGNEVALAAPEPAPAFPVAAALVLIAISLFAGRRRSSAGLMRGSTGQAGLEVRQVRIDHTP